MRVDGPERAAGPVRVDPPDRVAVPQRADGPARAEAPVQAAAPDPAELGVRAPGAGSSEQAGLAAPPAPPCLARSLQALCTPRPPDNLAPGLVEQLPSEGIFY